MNAGQSSGSQAGKFTLEDGPVLLYDGECGVCSHSVQWILRHERSQTLRFSPLNSPLGQQLVSEAGVSASIDSLLWIENEGGRAVARKWSDSVISVLDYVGGPWRLLAKFRFVPGSLRDMAYRLFAKYRLNVVSQACFVPTPETRTRFLADL